MLIVTTGKVDDDVTPGQGQGNKGEEGDEDHEDKSWWLLFRPQENGVDVVPELDSDWF